VTRDLHSGHAIANYEHLMARIDSKVVDQLLGVTPEPAAAPKSAPGGR
jgi:hypothetical protein